MGRPMGANDTHVTQLHIWHRSALKTLVQPREQSHTGSEASGLKSKQLWSQLSQSKMQTSSNMGQKTINRALIQLTFVLVCVRAVRSISQHAVLRLKDVSYPPKHSRMSRLKQGQIWAVSENVRHLK